MTIERKPHKHAEVIKAWADGATIQVRVKPEHRWQDLDPHWLAPCFAIDAEYRVKPEPKKLYIQTVRWPDGATNDVTQREKTGLLNQVEYMKRNYKLTCVGDIIEVELHPDA